MLYSIAHRIKNLGNTNSRILEAQIGLKLLETDIIRYEDIESRSIEIILKISKFLEIEIDKNKAKEISIKYSKSNIKKLINEKENEINNKLKKKIPIDKKEIVNFLGTQRVYDLKTGFQSNHISSRNTGDWKKKLDKSQIEILNKEFKNWLKEFEYE